jgi:hypothetical protein
MSSRKLSLVLVAATAVVLLAMVVVALATDATQEAYEYVDDPTKYAVSLFAHRTGVRLIFALDIAFLVLYTGFFAALAHYLRALGRPFTYLALGFLLATSVLDIVEDHHILTLLAAAEHNFKLDKNSLILQQVLSSTKFTVSYVALFMFGLAIPRTTKLGWALCLFLTAGTLITAVIGYAAPPEMREQLDSGRWTGFLIGFGIAGVWLARAPEPTAASG